MEQRSTWETTSNETKDNARLKFRSAVEITSDMSPGQKEFAEGWNEMRAELLKNNLMKKK